MNSEEAIQKIKTIIKEKIRPMLVMDGGNIEFVDYVDKIVKVKLTGACHGCPMAALTLRHGVENTLKEEIPEIEAVEALDLELDDEEI